MRSIPAELLAHLGGDVTKITLCWQVTRTDNVMILGTEEARDVEIEIGDYAGIYRSRAAITGSSIQSSSGLEVDNLEVSGTLPAMDEEILAVIDLSAADMEAGLLDEAAVALFLVNWEEPDQGQLTLRVGTLGKLSRTAEGQYRAELRGLTQQLRQVIIRTYGLKCDAELADSRCGVSIAARIAAGEVTSVVDKKYFSSTLTGGDTDPGSFIGGMLTWLSGENAGFRMEVKRDAFDDVFGNVELYEPMAREIQAGDTFTVAPGCDKTLATCRDRFDNVVNHRGYPLIPGRDKVVRFGGT